VLSVVVLGEITVVETRVVPVVEVESPPGAASVESTERARVAAGTSPSGAKSQNNTRLMTTSVAASEEPTTIGRFGSGGMSGDSMTNGEKRDFISVPRRWDNDGMWRQSAWKTVAGLSERLRQSGLSVNAAAVAYNAFLALVPLAFAMLGIAAAIGQSGAAVERIGSTLEPIVPGTVNSFITDLLIDAGERVGSGSVWLVLG